MLNIGIARNIIVELYADGQPSNEQMLRLNANDQAHLIWKLPSPGAKKLELKLRVDDTLDADNSVVADYRPHRLLKVALAGPECEPLRRTFDAMEDVAVTRLPDGRAAGDDFDLTVFYSMTPVELPEGNVALVAPSGNVVPLRVSSEVAVDALIATEDSPLMQDVDLSGVSVSAARVAEAPGFRPGATSSAGTVIGSLTSDDSTLIYVGFDFSTGNTKWPLDWSFPVFWANVVQIARGSAPSGWVIERASNGAANLLDAAESSLGGRVVPFSDEMLGDEPVARKASLNTSAWLAAAGLVLLFGHWLARR